MCCTQIKLLLRSDEARADVGNERGSNMSIGQILAVSIAEAVRLTGIGRSSLYDAIRRGDLPIRKSGRRTVVLMEDLRRWLVGLPTPHGNEVRDERCESSSSEAPSR